MKPPPLGVMLLAICVFIPPATFAQKPDFNEPIAKYDLSKEALSRVSLRNSGIAFAP